MKKNTQVAVFVMMLVLVGTSYAKDDQASLGTQAGEAVRELRGTAGETLSAGAAKVADTSKKVEAEAQDVFKTLQEQWDAFAKQLQAKTQQVQKQLQQQWQDFSKALNNNSSRP